MLKTFRRDPHAVLRYNAANLLVLTAALVAGWLWLPASFQFSKLWLLALVVFLIPQFFVQLVGGGLILLAFAVTGGFEGGYWLLALVPAGAAFAFVSGMLMHNAAHNNIEPRWLNRVVGELCGLHQLGGYMVWTIVHLVHHRHADDPEYDPHPPGTKTFTQYIQTAFHGLVNCMNRLYRDTWTAKDSRYRRTWMVTGVVGALSRITRLSVLLVGLGPAGFACFYVPSYVVVTLLYWHFNYATHRPSASGAMEVRNLDHNAYYRIVNALCAGFYFHKNHHGKPSLFNPADLRARVSSTETA